MMLRNLLLGCLFLFCGSGIHATNYFQKLSKFITEHGINDNIILSMFQDFSGVLWIGTKKGLCSYDGHDFESYPIGNSIDDVAVSFIDQLNDNELLLGTEDGNFRFSIINKSYTELKLEKSSPITSLLRDENHIFITSKTGIYQYKSDTHEVYLVENISVTCKQASPLGGFLLGSVGEGVLNAQIVGDSINIRNLYFVDGEEVLSVQYTEDGAPVVHTNQGLWLSNQKILKTDTFLMNY